jgi:CubicO group peptidase (beta-lactamase class C family)
MGMAAISCDCNAESTLSGSCLERISRQISQASADLAWPWPNAIGTVPRYRYVAPLDRGDGLAAGPVAEDEPALHRALLERIVQGVLDGEWEDVHGVLVHHRGRLVLEDYFYGYGVNRPHQMRSATKSVVSALASISLGRNGTPALDAPVLPQLPYPEVANPDPRKRAITLRHLLTMQPGLACNDWDAQSPGNESVLHESADWVKATLDLPMETQPGTVGRYCSGGVAVVGRLTELATGRTLPEFAHEALFAPLGIRREDWRWNYELTQRNREFSQIHLRPRDLLKLGLLYAQRGRRQGRQVIPEDWVQASLAPAAKVGSNGYGFFWWHRELQVDTPQGRQRVGFSAAQGNGGQRIILLPEHELVIVFTGGDYNSGNAPPNRILASLLLPALLSRTPPAPQRP